jgi:hypothetical protein
VVDKVRDVFSDGEDPQLLFTNLSAAQEEALRTVFAEEHPEDHPAESDRSAP